MKIKQGKASRSAVVMWVMMMMILVHAHVSIAAQEVNNNGTNYLGLIEDDIDSEFPDAISSHIHRRVLQQGNQHLSYNGLNANQPAVNAPNDRYSGASPLNPTGKQGCRDITARNCQ